MLTRLGEYLKKKRMTQVEFGRLADIPGPLISDYANGYRKPGLEHAFNIEDASKKQVPARSWRGFVPRRRQPTNQTSSQ